MTHINSHIRIEIAIDFFSELVTFLEEHGYINRETRDFLLQEHESKRNDAYHIVRSYLFVSKATGRSNIKIEKNKRCIIS